MISLCLFPVLLAISLHTTRPSSVERGRAKCHVYWPEAGQSVKYGALTITGLSSRGNDDYIIRELSIMHSATGAQRPCTQFQVGGFVSLPLLPPRPPQLPLILILMFYP